MRKILSLILGLLWALPVWGACYDYTSATGTVVQDGTPTPDNPIEPVFYQQGNMVLRKVGDVADSYDATTGKITRRIKETKLTPDGGFGFRIVGDGVCTVMLPAKARTTIMSTHFANDTPGAPSLTATNHISIHSSQDNNVYFRIDGGFATATDCMNWAQEQINAGTPVMIYSIMPTETEETIGTLWCDKIEIATTKYNETAFGPLNTALANAISVVDSVVSNTITQAGRIATLQAQKQTRPNDIADDNEKCPAGKKCLLVTDTSGIPHWYEIVTGRLPDGYTELEYIESTGTQYIDTNVLVTDDISWEGRFLLKNDTSKAASIFGYRWTETPTAQGNMRFVFIYPDGTFAVRFGVNASRSNLIISGSEVITLKYENDKFYANGNLFYTETDKNYDGEAQSGYLFNANALYNVDVIPSKMKLYYFKIWDNGTLVRDFVPALNPDGKIGMYDLVGGRFYENAGTGTFIGGQPVFN